MSRLGDFCCSPLGDFIASALHDRGCDKADCGSKIYGYVSCDGKVEGYTITATHAVSGWSGTATSNYLGRYAIEVPSSGVYNVSCSPNCSGHFETKQTTIVCGTDNQVNFTWSLRKRYYVSCSLELTFEATSYCSSPPYDDYYRCRQAVGAYSISASASLIERERTSTIIPSTDPNWIKSAVVNSYSGTRGFFPCGSAEDLTWADYFSTFWAEWGENTVIGGLSLTSTVDSVSGTGNDKLAVRLSSIQLPNGRWLFQTWSGYGEAIVARDYKGLVSIPLVDPHWPILCPPSDGMHITVSGTAVVNVRIT